MNPLGDDLTTREVQSVLTELHEVSISPSFDPACWTSRDNYLRSLLLDLDTPCRIIPISTGLLALLTRFVDRSPEGCIEGATAVRLRRGEQDCLELTFLGSGGDWGLVFCLAQGGELESLRYSGPPPSIAYQRGASDSTEASYAENLLRGALKILYCTPKITGRSEYERQIMEENEALSRESMCSDGSPDLSQPYGRRELLERLWRSHHYNTDFLGSVVDFGDRNPGIFGSLNQTLESIINHATYARIHQHFEAPIICFYQGDNTISFYLSPALDLSLAGVVRGERCTFFFNALESSLEQKNRAEALLMQALRKLEGASSIRETDSELQKAYAEIKSQYALSLECIEDRRQVINILLPDGGKRFFLLPERSGWQGIFDALRGTNPDSVLENATALRINRDEGEGDLFIEVMATQGSIVVRLDEDYCLASVVFYLDGSGQPTILYSRDCSICSGRTRQDEAERIFEQVWPKLLLLSNEVDSGS
jgi:hypothetical protein